MDGRFFTGVTTTGVFCRPICPAPAPKPANCRYFRSAAAARTAGFRPCLRCRPEAAPGTAAWRGSEATVSRALRLIEGGALDGDGDVESLAAKLGVGARHLRRLFELHLGATPRDVAILRRVLFAKQLLDETTLPILAVAESAGFGSVRRFNATMKAVYGRPPTALRAARPTRPTRPTRPARPVQRARRAVAASAEAERAPSSHAATPLVLSLAYRPPFAWDVLLAFLARRALPGVEAVVDGTYRRTLRTAAGPAGIAVGHDPERARLQVEVRIASPAGLLELRERLRRLFDLDADPRAIDPVVARVSMLRADVRRRPGLRVPGAADGFETAVRAILGQQISVAGATTLAGRIAQEFGERLPAQLVPGPGLERLFPTADRLAEAELERLGVIGARAAAIRGLARAVLRDPSMVEPGAALGTQLERWQALPGIGPWTAQLLAMRVLREPDALPASDLGLRQAITPKGDSPRPAAEVERLLEPGRPYRAYAAIRLWSQGAELEAEPDSAAAPA
ncbi:MAG: DNA-3-methyladenine glycosylase 2 family protein [Deltaproteobacteria bacterium]|nr:DNA-3-methyladenine glycosylase 2 family protein [Deltaproteobacteria bacterium]